MHRQIGRCRFGGLALQWRAVNHRKPYRQGVGQTLWPRASERIGDHKDHKGAPRDNSTWVSLPRGAHVQVVLAQVAESFVRCPNISQKKQRGNDIRNNVFILFPLQYFLHLPAGQSSEASNWLCCSTGSPQYNGYPP